MAKRRRKEFSTLDEESKLLYWKDQNKPWHKYLSIVHQGVDLKEIDFRSRRIFKFYCENCGHLLELSPLDLTREGSWCRFCSGKPELCNRAKECGICSVNTIASCGQIIVDNWSSKNNASPWQVRKQSTKKFIFDCGDCNKEYEALPSNISKSGIMCVCCTNPRVICKRERCDICFKKSFSYHYPERVSCWSDKNLLKPDKVTKGTDHAFLFDCGTCGHEFETMLSRINSGQQWCQYCSNTQKLCSDPNCRVCLDRSFASFDPEKVAQWSNKNTISPGNVKKRSDTKYLFDCHKCGHEFKCTLRAVTGELKSWCYYCVNKRLCIDTRKCGTCFVKTFASVADKMVLDSYSEKNELRPYQIFYGTDKKIIFDCHTCGTEFTTTPNNITNVNSWCNHCSSKRNKAINKVCSILDGLHLKYTLEVGIKLNNRPLHWDVTCSFQGTEFFIESDGAQHFSVEGMNRVSRGKLSPERVVAKFNDQRARDLLKETYINVNNGLLFRFSYRQTSKIESIVVKMLEHVKAGKTGVVYMDDIYWT